MKHISKIIKIVTDFLSNPTKRKVLHINRPSFDLSQKANLFTQFTNLEELTLYFDTQYSYELPKEIGQIYSLKKLSILNYQFTHFPLWLFDLSNLEALTIVGNTIKEIPLGIAKLDQLKHLRMEKTNLEALPPDFQQLTNLQTLSLVDNFKLNFINPVSLPISLKEIKLSSACLSKENRFDIKQLRPALKIKS